MHYLVRLAARNLWRHKRRTFLTFLAISVSLLGLIEVNCLMTGLDREAIQNLINLETGEVRIHAPGYFAERDTLPIDRTLAAAPVLGVAEGVDGVAAAAPRLIFGARLNTGWEEIPVVATGIDLERDRRVFDLGQYVEGRLPAAGTYEATLGYQLARILDLGVGDSFTLVTRTKNESFQALDLTIVGLLKTPHPQVNQDSVYLPLDVAAPALALDGQATEVALRLENGNRAREATVVKALEAAFRDSGRHVEVLTWRESAVDFLAMSKSERFFDGLFLLMILLIATVGVVNTILLGAIERTREIGMMKAMGMTEREIVLEFLLEATGIGLLGSLVGCLLGIAGNFYLVNHGFDLSKMYGEMDLGYPVTGVIHGAWNWPMILGTFIFGIVVCCIASYLPARKAAARDAIESLRQG